MTTIKRRISMMMFLAFVMFSVFIVGLAQGRVLSTPLKSEEGEEELSGVTVVARMKTLMMIIIVR
jgi:hypothetical protein